MKILHVIPKGSGGVSRAAEEIAKHHEKIYCNSSGFLGMLRSFVCALRLRSAKADIINFHDSVPAYFYTLLPHSKKVVYTSHGHWLGYFAAVAPRGFLAGTKARILIHMQRCAADRADAVVAVSKKVKNVALHISLPARVEVIYNGVDTKKFRPSGEKTKLALWVGDNAELKGLERAKEIAAKKKMKLLVVGVEGESDNNIEYLGAVHSSKMPEIYQKCSLLIYPSKWEGHPLVPLEAMASGLDIIASRESNIELIPLKGDFYVISGKAARKIAERNTWNHVRKRYQKFYKSSFVETLEKFH